ncbi:hypothetical protein CMI42_03435 [Candidatus Pacearchaeota archaeon]|nr:hypothetical protein [Candidatus Pacearchaeota archaeon]|tara:strand:- start:452 stop:1387 length:936 start_codon:yes stop_codon:yes gene_type:complete
MDIKEKLKESEKAVKRTAGLVGKLKWIPFIKYSSAYQTLERAYEDQVQNLYGNIVDGLLGRGIDELLFSRHFEDPNKYRIGVDDSIIEKAGEYLEDKLRHGLKNLDRGNPDRVVMDEDLIKSRNIEKELFRANSVSDYLGIKIPINQDLSDKIFESAYRAGNYRIAGKMNAFDTRVPENLDFENLKKEMLKDKGIFVFKGYFEGYDTSVISTIDINGGNLGHDIDTGNTNFDFSDIDNKYRIIANTILMFNSEAKHLGLKKQPIIFDRLPHPKIAGAVEMSHPEVPYDLLPQDFVDEFLDKYPEFKEQMEK